MEPRPPFHHSNNTTRYAPIPSPRFSVDRNFYHHHQQQQRLPPPPVPHLQPPPPQPQPPPPPPPPPPLRHPPQLPFPFEENPRVYDRLPFDHRQHPNFNNSYVESRTDSRAPPRVLVDWDLEPNRHHHRRYHHDHHPFNKQPLMSTYRDGSEAGFVQRKRFLEYSSREGFERNQKEELLWSQSDHNRDSENCVRHVVVDHHPSYGFEYDEGRTWNDRGNLGSFMRKQPESQHSAVMEYEDVVSDNGASDDRRRIFTGKRFYNQSKIGNFKDAVQNESSQEVICTPKKKTQRMSALLRVQLGNPGKKWKDEGSFSSGYFDDRNAGSSKSKGPVVFSGHGQEELREASPVELDVSFKSNALVAKAVTNPSSSSVGRDWCSTPNAKKRKVFLPIFGLSSLQLSEIHEGHVSGDNSTHCIKSNLDRGVTPLKEKVVVARISAMDAAVSKPGLNTMNLPHGNKTVMQSSASTIAGSIPTTKKKKKKKVVARPSSGLQNAPVAEVLEGVVNGDNSTCGAGATSSSKKCLTKSKGKTSVRIIKKVDTVGLQASKAADDQQHKCRTVVGLKPAGDQQCKSRNVVGLSSGPDLGSNGICTTKARQSKAIAPLSSFSSASITGNLGGAINANASVSSSCVDTSLGSDKGPGDLENKVTDSAEKKVAVSGIGKMDDVDSKPSHQVTVPLENCAIVGSLSSPCSNKLNFKRKKNFIDPLSHITSSRIKEVHVGPVNADGSTHGAAASSSSEKGLRKSDDRVVFSSNRTIKGATLQSIGKSKASFENCVGVESLSSSVVGSAAASIVKKKKKKQNKKKKVLNGGPSGLPNSTVTNIFKRPENEDGFSRGTLSVMSSDKSAIQSIEKVTAPISGRTGDLDSCSSDGLNLTLENCEVQSLLSPLSGPDDTLSVKKNEEVIETLAGFSNSGLTKFNDGTANADASSSDKCTMQTADIVTTSDTDMTRIFDLQTLHGTTVLPASNATAELLPSPVIDSNDTPKTNKQKFMENFGLSTSRVSETHDRSLNTDSSRHDTDPANASRKDLTLPDEKFVASVNETMDDFGSQPLHRFSSLLENSTVDLSHLSLSVGSELKYIPKIKKKEDPIASILCLSSSQATIFHDESVKADNCDFGVSAASGSSECLMLPAFPNLNSPFSQGLEGGWKKDLNTIMTGVNRQEYTLQNDNMELENEREREEKVEEEKAGEHGMFWEEKSEDIELHSQAQERLGFLPLGIQTIFKDGGSFGKSLENEDYCPPSQDELPSFSSYGSLKVEASGAFIHKSNGEGMDVLPDRYTSLSSQKFLSKSPESDILNSEKIHNCLFGKTNCKGNGQDGKPVDRKNSTLNGELPMTGPGVSVKLHEATHSDRSIPEKKRPLQSIESGKLSPYQKPKVGEFIGKKAYHVPQVPRVLPGRSTFASGALKETAALTHITRPRTWRRTDSTTLPLQESSLSTVSFQSNLQKNFGKIQNTSYIRKGNTLVRKSVPSASLTQGCLQLDPMDRHESKRSSVTVSATNYIDPASCLRIGFEKSKTPPLPENSGSPNNTTNASQFNASHTSVDPLLKGGFELTPDPIVVTESNVLPKHAGASDGQSGLIKNLETECILSSGNSKASKTRKIIYVKHKSNQLVASRNTEVGNNPVSGSENTQASPSTSCDQYYKKKKNQLIRSSPSLGRHFKKAVTVPDDSSNSESQMIPKVSSLKCSKNISRRKTDKVLVKACKPSKFSLVWTLDGQKSQYGATKSLQYRKVFPHLFPWKRTVHWRNVKSSTIPVSKTSLSLISKKLLLSRKRDTVYTRSAGGFSLRKSKVLSIGGSNLKWSKSIERRSKKVNEEATRAVAAVQRKKRGQNGAACAVASEKNRNQSSRERIFRIGSVRYKMDSSRRTLQRIPDEKSASSMGLQSESGKDDKKSFIPKRLLIGNDEYVRIGNGNQLVRDPKKLVRILASEKVRWSLHTARMRVAKKQQYCQFFTRFGKCKKASGKCPYIHDPTKVAVCTKFLKGSCANNNCKLTHKIIPERMQDCSYFLQGLCSNENCPYRHVKVNSNASVCEGFLRGYCADSNECRKKHTYVCPIFESTGICPQGSSCKLHHPKSRNKLRKRKRSKVPKKTTGRYFGSRLSDIGEASTIASEKPNEKKSENIFLREGRFTDYISLDVGSEEDNDISNPIDEDMKLCESDPSDFQSDELDELIKPMRIMKRGASL